MKWLRRIVLGLVLVVLAAYLARDLLARLSLESAVARVTGFPLSIGSVRLAIFDNKVDVREMRLLNPPDFPERLFVDLSRLYMDYHPWSFFSGEPHLKMLSVDLRQLVIVRNKKGESNLQRLRGVMESQGKPPAQPPAPRIRYRVDVLHVKVGQVLVKDFSGPTPVERMYPANINVAYKRIGDATHITRLVLVSVLSRLGLQEAGLEMDGLMRGLETVTDEAGRSLKEAGDSIREGGRNVLDKIRGPGPGVP